jgi:hypothetical protein
VVRHIKLMADYRCYPLWPGEGEPTGDIDPDTLPLSVELKRDLLNWAKCLDDALNWDDPAHTVWPEGFWTEFNAQGIRLAQRLRTELGPDWVVSEQLWGDDSA